MEVNVRREVFMIKNKTKKPEGKSFPKTITRAAIVSKFPFGSLAVGKTAEQIEKRPCPHLFD